MTVFTELSDAWAVAAWRATWQGGLAALVVWAACRLMPSIPARFQAWLWRLVMLKFAVAFLWATPVGVPLLPADRPATGEWTTSGAAIEPVEPAAVSDPGSPWRVAFLCWAVVVGVQLVGLLGSGHAARRLRANGRPCKDRDLLGLLATVRRAFGVRRPPAVLEADGDGSPLLVGLLRPAVVVPTATLARLDGPERAVVLGHELAHACRCDLAWGLFAAVVRAAFAFHPLAWLAERRLREAQEAAADDLAAARLPLDPVGYATLLLSVVSKLGPGRVPPALAVGVAGAHQSLERRFRAMRYMKPLSRRAIATYAAVLGLVALLGVVPWAIVAAQAPAAEKAEPKKTVDQKDKRGWGKLVSFKDGTLMLESNAGDLLVWHGLDEKTETVRFDAAAGKHLRAESTADALSHAKPGTWTAVMDKRVKIYLGARKGQVVGTFVSFKGDRLLLLGKDLGESYVKKYGNQLHFHKFRDDTPAFESIDGEAFKPLGPANKVLADVKEGTVITIHAEGDDNITLVQIGVEAKK